MNAEIGTEAAQYPENEYINGIFLACVVLFGPNLLSPSQLSQQLPELFLSFSSLCAAVTYV
jgi:hypothetical protein